jgi:Flp pilus assembly protein TadG
LTKLKTFAAGLRHNTSGISMVEFGLTFPLFVFATFGALELANLASANSRVSQIAHLVADNTSRVRDRIDEQDINEIMLAAKSAAGGADLLANGRIRVSLVVDNTATTSNTTDNLVLWQRCKGALNSPVVTAGTYKNYGYQGDVLASGIGPAGRQISAGANNPVVFVEVYYSYKGVTPFAGRALAAYNNDYSGGYLVHYTSSYPVRQRTNQTMQNGANLGTSATSACSLFSS